MQTSTVAELIKSWRWVRRRSAHELAGACGISHTTVLRIEAGQAPSSKVLAHLARGLRLSDDERLALYDAAGHPYPPELQ